MTRLLSTALIAGVLAISMSGTASARDHNRGYDGHSRHNVQRCKIVKRCKLVKVGHHRFKRVCRVTRVCGHGDRH